MRHVFPNNLFAPCLVGAVALGLGGCNAGERDRDRASPMADASPIAEEIDVDDLQDDPYEYAGREVRVVGEVDDPSYGDHAFVIQGDDWLFTEEVLVLGETPMRLRSDNLADGENVIIVGTVWVGDMPGLERELRWPIGENMADDWDDKAIIVAHSVTATDDGATWTRPAPSSSR